MTPPESPQRHKVPETSSTPASDVAETLEWSVRFLIGLIAGCGVGGLAWALASGVWPGLVAQSIAFLAAFPIGFLVGVFWPEVKLLGGFAYHIFRAWWH